MKKSQLFIDGKSYVSSSRASEIAGYSADYIGQLCRSRKINSRMVGRSWYVEMQSLLDHQKSVQKVNTTTFGYEAPKEPTKAASKKISPIKNLYPVFIARAFAVVLFAFGGFAVGLTIAPQVLTFSVDLDTSHGIAATVHGIPPTSMTAQAGDAFGVMNDLLHSLWNRVFGNKTLVAVTPTGVQAGLVVAPSTGSSTQNVKLVHTIENSFSDQVQVHEMDSNSGTITPVFKTVKGNDYLYVLVPVKATSSNAQQNQSAQK